MQRPLEGTHLMYLRISKEARWRRGRDVARGGAMLRTLDGILSDWGSHQGTESKGLAWSDLCVERIS